MKTSALIPGYYYDGKKGLRKIVRIEDGQVFFRKLTPAPYLPTKEGRTADCSASEFGRWAKCYLDVDQLLEVSMDLCVRSIKLTPAQQEGLNALARGEMVLGKVRTSLLERELMLLPSSVAPSPQLTEFGRRVLNKIKATSEINP